MTQIAPLDDSVTLVIGLVNNMPRRAQKSTELAFRALLESGAKNCRLQIRCFVLPGVAPPGPHYERLEAIGAKPIDGLIVTGTEPVEDRLDAESYWPELAQLVDWAAENTVSTIWSCLAAQIAVLRLDGIVRRRLDEKLSGVFDCVKVSDHPFVAHAPAHWPVPHSRLNDIDEFVLADAGYQILSRGPRIGADSFLKHVGRSLFLLLQGHPEYGADDLLREYRRDIKRFLRGQRASYPEMPEHYFDAGLTQQLLALQRRVREITSHDLLLQFDTAVAQTPTARWHPAATGLYTQWLAHLSRQKRSVQAEEIAGLAVT